jgi:hypothetical protein
MTSKPGNEISSTRTLRRASEIYLDEIMNHPIHVKQFIRNPFPNNKGNLDSIDDVVKRNFKVNSEVKVSGPLYCAHNNERQKFMNIVHKQNPGDISQKISSIAERIRTEIYNPVLFAEIACLLQSLASESYDDLDNVKPDFRKLGGIGLNSNLVNMSDNMKLDHVGYYNSALFSRRFLDIYFPQDKSPLFILHVGDGAEANNKIINEAIVTLFALNSLREMFPTFQYVYCSFLAPGSRLRPKRTATRIFNKTTEFLVDGKTTDYLFNESEFNQYNMVETLTHARRFYDVLLEDDDFTEKDFNCILAQIFLAIGIAQRKFDFSHNKLTHECILVEDLGKEYTMQFDSVFIKTRYVARIVDFTHSHVSVFSGAQENPEFISNSYGDKIRKTEKMYNTGITDTKVGRTFLTSNNLYDVLSFLYPLLDNIWEFDGIKKNPFLANLYNTEPEPRTSIFIWHKTIGKGKNFDDMVKFINQGSFPDLEYELNVYDYAVSALKNLKEKKPHSSPEFAYFGEGGDDPGALHSFPPILSCNYLECNRINIEIVNPNVLGPRIQPPKHLWPRNNEGQISQPKSRYDIQGRKIYDEKGNKIKYN